MATEDLRVGVVSDSASLVVALSLQGHGFDVTRIAPGTAITEVDVAVLDGPAVEDVEGACAAVPERTGCVLITTEAVEVDGTRVVQRPYGMAQLVEAIHAAVVPIAEEEPAEDDLVPEDEPATEAGPAHEEDHLDVQPVEDAPEGPVVIDLAEPDVEPEVAVMEPAGQALTRPAGAPTELFTSRSLRRPAPPVRRVERPAPPPPAKVDDPIDEAARRARSLTVLLRSAPFLKTRRRFASSLAAAIAVDLQAHTVVLWGRANGVLEVLGSSGLTDAERHMTPHARHPLFLQAAGTKGLVLRNGSGPDARLLGIPGSHAPMLAVLTIDDASIPVEAVTVGGAVLPDDVFARLRALLADAEPGWAAVQAVEALWHEMSH